MDLTSPDKLPRWTGGDPAADLNEKFWDLATAAQAAFASRQRHTYVWVDAAARVDQAGMEQSDEGYQLDTKTPYRFDGGQWRVATPHAEFTAQKALNAAVLTTLGVMTFVESASTSSTIAVPTADGIITLTDPGIYAATATVFLTGNPTGPTLLDIATTIDDVGLIVRQPLPASVTRGSVTIPNFSVANPNTPLYFKGYVTPGATLTTRVRITRWA